MFKLIMIREGNSIVEPLEATTKEEAIKEAFQTYTVTEYKEAYIWNVADSHDLAPLVAIEREKEKKHIEAKELEKKRQEYLKLKAIFEP